MKRPSMRGDPEVISLGIKENDRKKTNIKEDKRKEIIQICIDDIEKNGKLRKVLKRFIKEEVAELDLF